LPCLAFGNAVFRWHDGRQRGGIALDGCSALKLMCCGVRH